MEPNNNDSLNKNQRWAAVCGLIVLACLVYANTLHNTFQLDDHYRVLNNPGIQQVWPLTRHFVDPSTMCSLPRIVQYRPLLPLTLSFDYAIGKENPVSYHVFNIGLHTIASLIVFLLCLELLLQSGALRLKYASRFWPALAAAALFLIHPVSAIPVNYICARDLLLMQVFLMASLLAYFRMRRLGDTFWRWALVLVLYILALLSKTNAVVIPAVVLLYEWIMRGRKFKDPAGWLKALPFIATVAGFFAYIRFVLKFSDYANLTSNTGPSFGYAITQLKVHLYHYAYNFVWPFRLRQVPFVEKVTLADPGMWLGLFFVLSTLYFAWRTRKKSPLLSFCVMTYWALISLTSSIFPIIHKAVHYRPYTSSVFLYLMLAAMAFAALKRRTFFICCLIVITFFSAVTVKNNLDWRTEERLYAHSVKYGGGDLAHVNYAMSVSDLKLREKHLRHALKLTPNYIVPKINLGLLLVNRGDNQTGLQLLQTAVAQDPKRAQSHFWLSRGYFLSQKYPEALASVREAARLNPGQPRNLYEAARQNQLTGRYKDSIKYLQAIIAKNPGYKNAGLLLGFAYQKLKMEEEAILVYRQYLNHKPADYQAHFNLAYAYMEKGEYQKAISGFKKVLELKPDYREARGYLLSLNSTQ
ncbi:tetratricopeptide repeat protein [Candidatus Margulisiibacteriota bacterium]